MAVARRAVRHSSGFIALAKTYFPPGGSSQGSPGFELFSQWPLAAADELFARSFDELPEVAPGIRAWITLQTPFFPPIVFYGALVEDYVELLSLTIDDEYWELLDGDPDL